LPVAAIALPVAAALPEEPAISLEELERNAIRAQQVARVKQAAREQLEQRQAQERQQAAAEAARRERLEEEALLAQAAQQYQQEQEAEEETRRRQVEEDRRRQMAAEEEARSRQMAERRQALEDQGRRLGIAPESLEYLSPGRFRPLPSQKGLSNIVKVGGLRYKFEDGEYKVYDIKGDWNAKLTPRERKVLEDNGFA
jgi:hypothetical protein